MIASPLNQLKEIAQDGPAVGGRLRRIERVTLRHAHRFIIRRIANFREVRRHALGWLALILLLSLAAYWQKGIAGQFYTALVPAEAGIYTEGVFGALDNVNPIFASTPAERAASRLLFANIVTYDENGDLVGELAEQWKADESGRNYTVRLRANAHWSDGVPVTADDVLFTFNLIKNADTRSSLYASWRNIGVEKVDEHTVRFLLPVPYAAFANSLTIGILPVHTLKDVRASELRTEPFNRIPDVTNGPFTFQDLRSVDTNQMHYLLQLTANKNYLLGAPKVDGFHLHAYKDREALTKAFRSQEIASFSDAGQSQLKALGDPSGFVQVNAPLYNGVYAFLKTDSPLLSDVKVRQALQLATDHQAIVKQLNGTVQTLEGPLLPGQLGYRNEVRQPLINLDRAKALLDEAGWKEISPGKRQKGDQPLRLRLLTVSSGDFPAVAEELANQWHKIGVEFDSPQPMKPEEIQQNGIIPRAYDVLVYEVAIGRDPDVYAYWHSSQANDRGLNLSDYKSAKIDDALDSARTRLDPALREAKYRLFVQQWLNDVPAIGLYRPALAYVQNKNVVTFNSRPLVDANDRYFNIRYWAAGRELQRPTR